MSEEKVLKKELKKKLSQKIYQSLIYFQNYKTYVRTIKKELIKSARNDFNKYNYFELSDFYLLLMKLCAKISYFISYCDINSDIARITAVDL